MFSKLERSGRLALAGLIVGSLLVPAMAWGHGGDRDAQRDAERFGPRVDAFAGWFHDAGNLLLHVSNRGRFGRTGTDVTNPSAEWPAGSNNEYLYGAGLWVGGVINRAGARDTLVSAGLYQFGEFYNRTPNEGCGSPPVGICETFEGAPSGLRLFDDDGDGSVDEDPLDGADNDGDGRIDEDFAGISQQMFRTVYYDTSIFFNQFFNDDAAQHTPMGLKVVQESYVWTDPQFDDFVGIEFRITNISEQISAGGDGWDINSAYVGFMVDGDVGIDDDDLNYWEDDQGAVAEIDTTITPEGSDPVDLSLTLGYIYDELGGENASDDVTGFCGVMFLGHNTDSTFFEDPENALAPGNVGIHAFRIWSGGDQDPRDDLDRYRFLRGLNDTARTIDAPTSRANDYRFLVSAGPFSKIPPGSTLTFQVAFVCGEMVEELDPDTQVLRRVPDFTNPIQAQRVYNGFLDQETGDVIHWATSSPPPPPEIRVTPGDDHVVVEWDDFPEGVPDPLTRDLDFAGYQVWKAEGWRRESNIPSEEMWRLIADFDTTDISDIDTGLTGIGKYRFVDTRVQNGFWYWYAVTAYDRGIFSQQDDGQGGTVLVRTSPPKYGKYTQNMQRVMPSPTATQTLDDIYVVPNPYKASAAWDLSETNFEPTGRRIKFFNLPERATIRIFTLAGDHVATLNHDNRTAPEVGQTSWNLISKNNQDTVSGIYLYHVESGVDGSETIGKFVIIR
jgi:hypothetical protein